MRSDNRAGDRLTRIQNDLKTAGRSRAQKALRLAMAVDVLIGLLGLTPWVLGVAYPDGLEMASEVGHSGALVWPQLMLWTFGGTWFLRNANVEDINVCSAVLFAGAGLVAALYPAGLHLGFGVWAGAAALVVTHLFASVNVAYMKRLMGSVQGQ